MIDAFAVIGALALAAASFIAGLYLGAAVERAWARLAGPPDGGAT